MALKRTLLETSSAKWGKGKAVVGRRGCSA